MSRKKQLKALAADKKRRRAEAADEWTPPDPAALAESDAEMDKDIYTEDVGLKSARDTAAYKGRRSRERLRGVSQAAHSMDAWLQKSPSAAMAQRCEDRQVVRHAEECVATAVAKAISVVEAEEAEAYCA